MKQKGLGRGLDAIFGGEAPVVKAKPMSQMAEIAVKDIIPNPTQPRREFDEEALAELADSIRTAEQNTKQGCFPLTGWTNYRNDFARIGKKIGFLEYFFSGFVPKGKVLCSDSNTVVFFDQL